MSETPPSQRSVLYLVTEGVSPERRQELGRFAEGSKKSAVEIFPLLETNGAEALQKIFGADAVAVWGEL